MPMPSPNMPPENTGSGTSASGTTGPVSGASSTNWSGDGFFNWDSSARLIVNLGDQ